MAKKLDINKFKIDLRIKSENHIIVACEAGVGIISKAEMDQEVDFIIVSSESYKRVLGFNAEQAKKYTDNANEYVAKLSKSITLLSKETPIIAGVNAHYDMENIDQVLEGMKEKGYNGIINQPSFGRTQEHLNTLEVELLQKANDQGLLTLGVVYNLSQLKEMEELSVDVIVIEAFDELNELELNNEQLYLITYSEKDEVNEMMKRHKIQGVYTSQWSDSEAIEEALVDRFTAMTQLAIK